MKRKLVTIPDKRLREACAPVDLNDPKTKIVIKDLFDTLQNNEDDSRVGVGLAAPQIGENLRVAIVEYSGDTVEGEKINRIPRTVLINPKVIKYSSKKTTADEGCFSVPQTYGPVSRPEKIKVLTQNEKGESVQINASGYYARVLQHEIDHLDGILFIDRADPKKTYKIVYEDNKVHVDY